MSINEEIDRLMRKHAELVQEMKIRELRARADTLYARVDYEKNKLEKMRMSNER